MPWSRCRGYFGRCLSGFCGGGEGGEALEGGVAGLGVVGEVVGAGGALEAADEEREVPAVEVVAVGFGGEAGEEVGGSLVVAGFEEGFGEGEGAGEAVVAGGATVEVGLGLEEGRVRGAAEAGGEVLPEGVSEVGGSERR